jgi:signal transduction histidine kinase
VVHSLSRLRPRLTLPSPVDLALAGAFVALTLLEGLVAETSARSPVGLVVAAVSMAALAWRRQFPLVVAALVLAAILVTDPESEFSVLLALVLVAFTVGSETDPPRSHVGLAIVVVPFVAVLASEGLQPSDLAAALVFLVGPWAVGTLLRQRTSRTLEAVARAEAAERDRELQAAEAAAAERTRIARELHDIVSHSISVVTIQTQAVRRRLGPEQEREAADLAAVEATAREALAEMRRLFGVLRGSVDGASLAPQPGLADAARQVELARATGLEVTLRVDGEAYPLPPGVDLAAYRILQEGLTNALRHADATRVDVLVRYGPGGLDLAVEDDGHGGHDRDDRGGHGLVGVRERVALYQGWVSAGPGPSGGFRLRAWLPVGDRPVGERIAGDRA